MTLGWILEESIEHYSEVQDLYLPMSTPFLPSLPSPPLARCYLCHEVVIGSESLRDHLFKKHSNRHAFVRANGRVVQEDVVLRQRPESLDVTVTGDLPAAIRIRLDGGPTWADEGIRDHLDVSHLLQSRGLQSIEITLLHAGHEQRFTIYADTALFKSHEEIDRSAFSLLFVPLRDEKEPDFHSFRARHLHPGATGLELRYSEGFFAFAKGFSLARSNNQASKEHFEEAFERLLSFGTPFAVFARRVLALRMNAFLLLRDCSPSSLFFRANTFFNGHGDAPLSAQMRLPGGLTQGEYGVFTDIFTGRFLEALGAFYSTDWSNLALIVEDLDTRIAPHERNNRDKLTLLLARSAALQGLRGKAAEHYATLQYHPLFGSEATEWVK